MPRIRTIKPEIWTSRDFMSLSTVGQLAFIALITLADDEGRVEADAAYVRATCLRDQRTDRIRTQLRHAEDNGMLIQYTVASKPYIQLTNWGRHQRVDKPRPSSLPPPPSRTFANDREDSPTLRDPSRSRARPRIGSDLIGEDQGSTPKATSSETARARSASALSSPSEDPDVLAYAERFMYHAGRAPSADDLAFFRRVPYDCGRLSREVVLTAIDEVAEKHVGRGKPMPRATYLAGRLADLQAEASDAGVTARSRSPNGRMTSIGDIMRRDPDDE